MHGAQIGKLLWCKGQFGSVLGLSFFGGGFPILFGGLKEKPKKKTEAIFALTRPMLSKKQLADVSRKPKPSQSPALLKMGTSSPSSFTIFGGGFPY